ncbi:hypothetical protein F0562_033222 [Nyssa sinensis]|uniref:Pectate lyase n=1 Tax=Nyssa sinensis TaxID=561372 RepID=A0A5J5AQ45_9ASTE|nr:hypothetical protein F0562_033222 [Nyssa sinensis]
MPSPLIFLILLPLLAANFISSSPVQDPELVVQEVQKSINASRRNLGFLSCGTGNPIDDCWRCDPNWEKNRQRLADCAIGFGKHAVGGRDGRIYVVTDSGDYDPVTPKPGTLRYAVIQEEPLWIIFARDMVIKLKEELIMNSFKTIDGRGASVHIAGGHALRYTITISNNYMTHHDKVMLLGHSDTYTDDKNMQVTIAFNHFGEGLVQRMPRCRHGYFHVVNNDYTHWEMYAIGGSAAPTINSQGNRFMAPNDRFNKEVTKHEEAAESEWRKWNWRSEGDLMLNGAFFTGNRDRSVVELC